MRSSILLITAFISPVILHGARPSAAQGLPTDVDLLGRVILSIGYAADQPIERAHYDGAIGLKPGDTLTRMGVKGAIQALYDTGRFSQITAHAVPEGSGVRLEFHLGLNYYFNRFVCSGNIDLEGRLPWEVLPLPVGQRFTDERLEDARLAVIDYLVGKGYYRAEVGVETSRDEVERQVDTEFEVRSGELAIVRSVSVAGVPPAEEEVIRDKFSFKQGKEYERRRLQERMDKIKEYFLKRGFLAAVPRLTESYNPLDNTIALDLNIASFGEVRVLVDGFKIQEETLRRLLPVLAGEGITPALLEEGSRYLQEHLEDLGYPEADIRIREDRDPSGMRILRYVIEAGHKVTVKEVLFKGNGAFSAEELSSAIQIKPARFLQKSVYSVAKLDSDIDTLLTLYRSAGYLDIEIIPLIEPLDGAERLRITFECEEGRRSLTRSVTFSGNRTFASESLRSIIDLRPGFQFSPHQAERDRQAIIRFYNDAGFLQPRVTYRVGDPDESAAYPVEFEITEGVRSFVDNIIILGNDHTRDSVIEKRFRFAKDDPLSLGALLETQQALYDLGAFEFVRVAPQNPESVASHQNVVVRVEEASQFSMRYSVGYEQRAKVRGMLELGNLRIFGTQRRADLRLRASAIERGAILSFRQSQIQFLPVNSFFTISARYKEEISFDATRMNLSYQYSLPLGNHSWGQLRYRFRNVHLSNLKISESDIEREDKPRNLSTFSAVYINDTRDYYLDPESGFFTSTDLSVTTKLLGSNNYVSLFTQNSYYRRLPASFSMAAGLRFGFEEPYGGDQDIPISEKFFAGGASSLRGFDTDRAGPLDPETNKPVGGKALLIGNLEIRYPIMRFMNLAGFYDGGNVFRSLGEIRMSDVSHTLGIGLRIKTPLGPIRIDYGFNLNLSPELRSLDYGTRQLFVTIGPPF
jgi:outer membrane protein insertion porin family